MHYLFTVLDILCLSWFLYFPLVVVPIACYYFIVSGIDSRYYKWSGWPLFWLAALGGAALYRWPAIRVADWRTWLYWTLGYVAAGFAVALYKWIAVLVEFRKGDVAGDIARAKAEEDRINPQNHAPARLKGAANRLAGYSKCQITWENGIITVYPDWRLYPIATWWTYWVFFVLSIPFDWLTHGIEWAARLLKDFWNGIAQRFSVRG